MTPNGPISNYAVPDVGSLVGHIQQSKRQFARAFKFFNYEQVVLHCPFWTNYEGPAEVVPLTRWITLPKEPFIYDIGCHWPDGAFDSLFKSNDGIWDRYPHCKEVIDRLVEGTAWVLFHADAEVWCN